RRRSGTRGPGRGRTAGGSGRRRSCGHRPRGRAGGQGESAPPVVSLSWASRVPPDEGTLTRLRGKVDGSARRGEGGLKRGGGRRPSRRCGGLAREAGPRAVPAPRGTGFRSRHVSGLLL